MACADKAHQVDGDGGAEACSSTPQAASTSTLMPLELIDELVAATVTGQRHLGRDGNAAATAVAKACDDASATRTGPHAPHHVELLAAANFVAGPVVTGLAHTAMRNSPEVSPCPS